MKKFFILSLFHFLIFSFSPLQAKLIKVLAIGNSFSQDATRYLTQIAAARGVYFRTVNLYIGGCPLVRHYNNLLHDARAYSLEYGGETTGFYVSIRQALRARKWDVITLQQVSHTPDI